MIYCIEFIDYLKESQITEKTVVLSLLLAVFSQSVMHEKFVSMFNTVNPTIVEHMNFTFPKLIVDKWIIIFMAKEFGNISLNVKVSSIGIDKSPVYENMGSLLISRVFIIPESSSIELKSINENFFTNTVHNIKYIEENDRLYLS